ncbi:MAG TPA: Gfo/Idh/MocA family oxidoreductase [Pontiella sp.]|nr:Gfo/Idh/MocA family oxidoreductase [Pontiella sp.]
MIIVDQALRQRSEQGRPIRVGLVGVGTMGAMILKQIVRAVPGMRVAAIANRTPLRAMRACTDAGINDFREAASKRDLQEALASSVIAITEDANLLCEAEGIEAIVDATGAVEFGARLALKAFEEGKHLISLNAELDATIGSVLQLHARKAGVIYTLADGDQPGVEMNLWRQVRGFGMEPLVCGNIKGLHDAYRTPTTQKAFALKWRQNPYMVTSFADGSKVSMEQACVANATGMQVEMRGMRGGPVTGHVDELCQCGRYDVDRLRELGGVVDYVVGAHPAPGVFVLATHQDPSMRRMLDLYKLGAGPLYCFYTPYHLCHFEMPLSIARVVLFGDAVLQAQGPMVDVASFAKKDLKAGEVIDGIGGYMAYGQCENHAVVRAERLLPLGLAEGCRVMRDIPKDAAITYDDIAVPEGRICDVLRLEQEAAFPVPAHA